MKDAPLIIIGGGPSGLRAAEVARAHGLPVEIYEGRPSCGHKFLLAGRSGLNLSKDELPSEFAKHYHGPDLPRSLWMEMLNEYDSCAMRTWAASLGVDTFVASSRRIYPKVMRAAPLLRAWLNKLQAQDVAIYTRHRWHDLIPGNPHTLVFETPDGKVQKRAHAVVFALGGASWPRTGSDGKWTETFRRLSVRLSAWSGANNGWEVSWPHELIPLIEGKPLKNIGVRMADRSIRGELMLTHYGIEGGALYQLGPFLRHLQAPVIHIDFKPDATPEQLIRRLGTIKHGVFQEALKRWRLDEGAAALLRCLPPQGNRSTPGEVAEEIKNYPLPLRNPRPVEEAISSAGGVAWEEVDNTLMVKKYPGVFLAGEMLDWEAPTGGYLLHGSFVTGALAARSAARYLQDHF